MNRYTIITLSLAFLIWIAIVHLGQIPSYILPSPSQVLKVYTKDYAMIINHSLVSSVEILSGFSIGLLLGTFTGLLIDRYVGCRRVLLPFFIALQAIPLIALMPLLVIWCGHGIFPKIVIIAMSSYFPISLSLFEGLRQTPQSLMDLCKTLNATPIRTLLLVRFPWALPTMMSGVKLAAIHAPVTVMTADWIGAESGLGYLIMLSGGRIDLDLMFACIFVLVGLSFAFFNLINAIQKRIIFWQTKGNGHIQEKESQSQ